MSNSVSLNEHQKDAVAHSLYGGSTLFAHCVGAGKTFEMVTSIMEAKRLGYRQAVIPAGSDVDDSALPGLRVVEVATIHDALRLIQ